MKQLVVKTLKKSQIPKIISKNVFKFTSCCILKISHILPHEVRVWLIAICHTISYEVSYIMHEQTCQLAIIKRVTHIFNIFCHPTKK